MKTKPVPEFPLPPPLEFMRRVWRLSHSLERASLFMERRLGVTAQQRFLVRCVGRFPGITMGELARVLHVDPGTVTATVVRLEKRGLVERKKDPIDSRRVTLGLTKEGRTFDVPTEHTIERIVERMLESTDAHVVEDGVAIIDLLTARLEAMTDSRAR